MTRPLIALGVAIALLALVAYLGFAERFRPGRDIPAGDRHDRSRVASQNGLAPRPHRARLR